MRMLRHRPPKPKRRNSCGTSGRSSTSAREIAMSPAGRRQTRLSLNNEMSRLDRVFLVTGDCCAREFLRHEHPGLIVADATSADGTRLLHEFPPDGRPYSLFIVDP